MCTFGNLSDELLRKDISKLSVGFIPDLSNISKQSLIQHLVTNCDIKYSRKGAKEAINVFFRELHRHFWDMTLQNLTKYENTGVDMYILGLGIRRLFFRLAYIVGDDPALHKFCGVYEGNSNHSCLHCLYSLRKDGYFNEHSKIPKRNVAEIIQYQKIAELAIKKKINKETLQEYEKDAIKYLHKQSLHCFENITTYIPMGNCDGNTMNSIYNGPADLLHTFDAGLFKSLDLWIITIILNISKLGEEKYKFSPGLLDSRLISFRNYTKVPNITIAYFRKGICYIISENKSNKEKSQTTGGAGGFRSVEYVSLALQLFIAVSK
jgi:hypothetical protein